MKKLTFKKLLLRLFFSSILVFISFIIFYYFIGRLYILRLGIEISQTGKILFSPPQLFNFFVFNLSVFTLSIFFLIAIKLAELGEKKFSGKKFNFKINSNKLRFIAHFYFIFFVGGLFFSYLIWKNPQKLFPVLNEDKIFNLVNEYRFSQQEKQPLTKSEFSCQIAKEKLYQLSETKTPGVEIGGSGQFLEAENEQRGFYAFNYIKNVANENQVLFWWQQSLDQNDILVTTNHQGEEITKGCVETIYHPDYSLTVIVVSSI